MIALCGCVMAEFAEILADVEAASRAGAPFRFPQQKTTGDAAFALCCNKQTAKTDERLQSATAAYRQHQGGASPDVAQSSQRDVERREHDGVSELLAHLAKELKAARRSPARLKALRRKAAWRFHPDRWSQRSAPHDARESALAMAQFNALIDAAIAESRDH